MVPRVSRFCGAAALTFVLAAFAPSARAGDAAEAESLIRQGVELRSQKKDERALPLFEKAYQISRSPRTAGQLGLVEMALGYFVDAERYLSEAVASPDHPWVAKNLPTLKAQLAAAKGQIGELYIVGEPSGAEVLVNGKSVGRLPLSTPIRLDKGRADIQVRAAGYTPASDTIMIFGGKREDRSYRLVREAVAAPVAPPPPAKPPAKEMPKPVETKPPVTVAAAPSAPPPAPPPASAPPPSSGPPAAVVAMPPPAGDKPSDGSSLRPYAIGAGVAAAAGLILGTVEGIVAIKKKNEFNDHKGPDPNDILGPKILDCNTTFLTADCKEIMDSHDRARTLSIVGFVAGALLAGGATVLWVLSSPSEKPVGPTSAFACAPDVGTRGVACRLQF